MGRIKVNVRTESPVFNEQNDTEEVILPQKEEKTDTAMKTAFENVQRAFEKTINLSEQGKIDILNNITMILEGKEYAHAAPFIQTTKHLEDISEGTFIYSVREIHDEPFILEGVVTKADKHYEYTDQKQENSELRNVELNIRWFAGIPDHYFGTEVGLTDYAQLYVEGNQNTVFLSPEEAVFTFIDRKRNTLQWRLEKLQQAKRDGRTATFLYEKV